MDESDEAYEASLKLNDYMIIAVQSLEGEERVKEIIINAINAQKHFISQQHKLIQKTKEIMKNLETSLEESREKDSKFRAAYFASKESREDDEKKMREAERKFSEELREMVREKVPNANEGIVFWEYKPKKRRFSCFPF